MKTPIVFSALLLCLAASSASAAVNLVFGTGATYATNWANAAGVGGTTLVWGVVIDTAGDGFDANGAGYRFGNSLTTGQHSLYTATDELSDDVLYVASAPMTITTASDNADSATIGLNRIGTILNMPLTGAASTGDPFAVIWFDETVMGSVPFYGEEYGMFTHGSFQIPNDPSSGNYTGAFTGPDALKQMTYTWAVPEPSGLLLGLAGAAGFLRRRRR